MIEQITDKKYNTVRKKLKDATNGVIDMHSKYSISNKARQMVKEYKVKIISSSRKYWRKKEKLHYYPPILLEMKTTTSFKIKSKLEFFVWC